MKTQSRPLRFALHLLFGLGAVAIFAVIFGGVAMVAWNAALPELFGWPPIGFGQAVAVLVLARVLTGRFTPRHGRWHHHPKAKGCFGPARASDRDAVYADWWRDEGETAFHAYAARKLGQSGE